jgi:hypothetical protein
MSASAWPSTPPGGDIFKQPLPPIVQNTSSLLEAVHTNNLGVGYAAGGFLVFYFLGVSKVLQQLGVVRRGAVRTAGSSIGALVQGIDHPGGGSHDDFVRRGLKFCERCAAAGNCFGTLDTAYANLLEEMLSPDVAQRISGKACLVVSRNTSQHPLGQAFCDYNTRGEVLEALRTSAFVPGWSSKQTSRPFRGGRAFDGIFSQPLPCPHGVKFCIKISALPRGSPSPGPSVPDAAEVVSTAGLAAGLVGRLFGGSSGRSPAGTGAAASSSSAGDGSPLATLMELVNSARSIDLTAWTGILSSFHGAGIPADIWPGKYGRRNLPASSYYLHMLVPPDAATAVAMFEEGQLDGRAWAREQGWPGA